MLLAVLLLAIATVGNCEVAKCPTNLLKYYKELKCTPNKDAGSSCPTSFDCTASLSNRNQGKCYLNGVVFEPKQVTTSDQIDNPCVVNCFCNKYGARAGFQCTQRECPELFQDRLEDNCVRLYTQGSCCSTGTYCDNSTVTTSKAKDSFTCSYAGRNYVLGQQFYPSEEPCKKCICQTGYDGTLNGPWCSEISCGIEMHYGSQLLDGCAPIHFGKNGCCPIGWRCPDAAKDRVIPASSGARSSRQSAKCTFGQLSLNIEDGLSSDKACVECKCSIPPHVSCTQRGYC